MRAVVQRVKRASVHVEGKEISHIGEGLLILLGVRKGDEEKDLDYIYRKIVQLRIFDDEDGVMNQSLVDQGKSLLIVSQFTLYGDCRKGNRPSWFEAAAGTEAENFYRQLIDRCRKDRIPTEEGLFGGDMEVSLVNDGPVTVLLDSEKKF